MLCGEFVTIYCSVLSNSVVDDTQNTILFTFYVQTLYIELFYKYNYWPKILLDAPYMFYYCLHNIWQAAD